MPDFHCNFLTHQERYREDPNTFTKEISDLEALRANACIRPTQDFAGVAHPGPLNFLDANIKAMSLPALPFSICMPALSLLLVFRTNTAYGRFWEARKQWGVVTSECRNLASLACTFMTPEQALPLLKVKGKEEKIEVNLASLLDRWLNIEFLADMYKGTEVPLLKVQEEDWEALEADQLRLRPLPETE